MKEFRVSASVATLIKVAGIPLLFASAGAIAIYQYRVVDPEFERVSTGFQNLSMADLPSIKLSRSSYSTLVTVKGRWKLDFGLPTTRWSAIAMRLCELGKSPGLTPGDTVP